ncbi:rhodanese-like domain-containing protein [Actinoplanes sp. KI2]|uniref:MBL fold metallo-hydrolase n=1 Tax=Actinoplanes sp. KI2 TaxID=2983315 RepID=UPI0021D59361|nr:MBL fold metallo-hydrolase [Actinoplanes sp. KI2]MCU7729388.1 rhodanese-like domain-containing protein [Actinoplanes sp. KI2]
MLFMQYYLDCMSQASYLIADESTCQAVLVDPRRDIAEYLADADAHGLSIEGVINTHFHADFVAGHLEVAAATGAWIGYGQRAETEYPIRKLAHGDRISLGETTLEIMETPGHTPESISVLVYEHPGDTVPYGVLTGDALFIGDVGRPDLLASAGVTADELGRMLYDSVQHKLMGLPDAVRVFPAHGAGSACGKSLSTERQSTVGEQRRTNYACAPMDVEQFLTLVTGGQPAAPSYFAYDAALNRQARALLDHSSGPRALSAAEFTAARTSGALVVDARDPQEYAAGYVRGSLNIPADGRFAETAGTVIAPGRQLLVVAAPDRAADTVLRLARVGFDTVAGYLADPEASLADVADQLTQASRLTVPDLHTALQQPVPPLVLDVRNASERDTGAIADALHIPLAELPHRLDEIPTYRPVVVHCAGGYRSSVAASLLRAHGHPDVSDLIGGYNAWHTMLHPTKA